LSFISKKSGKITAAALLTFLVAFAFAANVRPVSAYSPQKGDSFNYSETVTVNNGQGSYSGYSDQTTVTGMEQVDSVSGSTVSSSYKFTSQFSSSQGSSTSNTVSGAFTWSSGSFTYLNGTDDQVGYAKPTYVWFAIDPSHAVGDSFQVLNTQFTVLSKDYSLQLPTEGDKYVQTIETKGSGQYQRNDSYGVFSASFTWYEYFDPATGYIVGYSYVEQDSGQGQSGSFSYTDNLYVTSTSYPLAAASAPVSSAVAGMAPDFLYLAVVAVLVIIIVAAYAASRRRRRSTLPKHPYTPQQGPPTPSPTPWESKVDLGSKPTEQVVIRDVAKTNCKFCGTLIPTTVDRCPYCGAPRE